MEHIVLLIYGSPLNGVNKKLTPKQPQPPAIMDNSLLFTSLPVIKPITAPLTFDPKVSESPAPIVFTTTHHDTLLRLKNEIEGIKPEGMWDDVKKITNPFEFIFISLHRRMKDSICGLQPLSRSFFKMIELWDILNLSPTEIQSSAHTAEGPGGFLEAIQYRVKHSVAEFKMVAMTLRSSERSVIGWRKSDAFLESFPSIHITYGSNGTGNLYHLENQEAFTSEVDRHLRSKGCKADIYTADGGFDFSADFNGQENSVQRLLVAEALAGLTTLKSGDHSVMILKLFDTKCRATLEILWILSSCFNSTMLIKPRTSRPANSERYWIGKGFRGIDETNEWIIRIFRSLISDDRVTTGWDSLLSPSDHKESMDAGWLREIQGFQEEMEVLQVETIQKTLALIREPAATRASIIMPLLQVNIANSRKWCSDHKMPLNPRFIGLSEAAVARLNLAEAMEAFQQLALHNDWLGGSPNKPKHRVWLLPPSQSIPTGQVWRQPIPASVLGRATSQKAHCKPPFPSGTRPQSVLVSSQPPQPPESSPPLSSPPQKAEQSE